MSRSRTLLGLLGLVGALPALGSCGCVPIGPPLPVPPRQHRVVVIGDSITVDTREELEAEIAGVLVDAVSGRGWVTNAGGQTFPNFREAVATLLPTIAPGGWLVIQDDGGEGPTDAATVQWVTDLLPDDRGLAWVSPSNDLTSWNAASQTAVRAGILAQPINSYVDWHGQQAGLVTDGLHPNQDGQWVLAELIGAATSAERVVDPAPVGTALTGGLLGREESNP